MDGHCQYCGFIHTSLGTCHRVQSIEYYQDGTVKAVTLFPLLPTVQERKYDDREKCGSGFETERPLKFK